MATTVPLWKLTLAGLVLVTVGLSLAALPAWAARARQQGSDGDPSPADEPEDNLAVAFEAPSAR